MNTRDQKMLTYRKQGLSYTAIAKLEDVTPGVVANWVYVAQRRTLGNTPEWFYRNERFKEDMPIRGIVR